ncbi:PE-PGRS family protein [Streptomyces abyssomicinicus]|uniref:PE-PGRS family protein n=1 Tax=Streptomyces abyssomicinicus TaxID=574929 RepID=UPI00124FD0FB|nr:PE-PGRS family protein [Streptomyces abyssomicinicus]
MGATRNETEELLRRAGLEAVAPWRTEPVLSVRAAWRTVTGGGVPPSAEVPAGRPAEADAAWNRLAAEAGILDAAGPGPHPAVFLVQAGGRPHGPRMWTRVRLASGAGPTGALGDFVTLSLDGGTLIGVVTENGTTRLTVVDDVPARIRAAAEADAAPRSAREQAAAWDALLGTPPRHLPLDAWATGLAVHRDAPEALLLQLLERDPYLLYRRLPPAVLAAALTHPDRKLRQDAFEQQPLTREQRSGMILAETDERTRWVLALLAADRRDELTEEACERLATDPSTRIRLEAVRLTGLPVPLALRLAEDPEPTVRSFALLRAWAHLDDATRRSVLEDPRPEVRRPALLLHHREHPLPQAVFASEALDADALRSCLLADDLIDHVLRDGDPSQRAALADNPRTPTGRALRLTHDPDPHVRWNLALRADLTEEQRAAVEIDFDPAVHHFLPLWIFDLHDDPEAMRRLAGSAHPLVRRGVARARRLPPDVVERLARDEDRVVQLFLAESCDDAPAEMLLRVAQWWTGSLSTPDRPRSHPNFPREGLRRFADHPEHRLRRLALDDPASTPGLVERLARDPHELVRIRAAEDPRLSAAGVALLLDDPSGAVRKAARRHPRLPLRRLLDLLRDPRTAAGAVSHPAIPEEVVRRMIGLLDR